LGPRDAPSASGGRRRSGRVAASRQPELLSTDEREAELFGLGPHDGGGGPTGRRKALGSAPDPRRGGWVVVAPRRAKALPSAAEPARGSAGVADPLGEYRPPQPRGPHPWEIHGGRSGLPPR